MYKVSIFIPIYYREELVKQCLASLAHTDVKEFQLDVTLNRGINGARKSFMDTFLDDYIRINEGTVFSAINVYDPGENIGKAKIINEMAFTNSEFDYLVSIDSDMELMDVKWLNKMLSVLLEPNQPFPIGAVCANQINNSMHKITNTKKVTMGELTLVCTPGNIGVSGGVLLTSADLWYEIAGYRAGKIFGDDDTSYASDCHMRGMVMGYIEEVEFFHPSDDNVDYAEWKNRAKFSKLEYFDNQGFYEFKRYEK
jgi:hypothetical protein